MRGTGEVKSGDRHISYKTKIRERSHAKCDRSAVSGLWPRDVASDDFPLSATRFFVSDEQGKPFSVRYEAVNAMLLNEFLKEHTVQEQGATIAEFKKEIANLTATVKEQAAQIQKVSAQVELSKPAPRTVLNIQ